MLRRALLLLAITACGGTMASSSSTTQSITLHSTGGFIGEDMTFVLASDGSVVATGHGATPAGTTHQTSDAAAALFDSVTQTGVLSVAPGSYLPPDTCCDRIQDSLTITTASGSSTYDAMADGAGAPSQVLSALQLVHQYIDGAH